LSFILAFSFFSLQAQEENRPSTHQMFLNQHKSWEKEHPEYFQPATTSEALAATPLQPKITPLRKEIFGYMPYWWLAQVNNIDYSLVSTIAYFSVEIDGNGGIVDQHGWSSSSSVTTLINTAHTAGVRVVLCMTNFTATQISSIVNTPSIKKKVIDTLYSLVSARNGDGVNINFENIPSGNRDSLTSFMRDLATKFHTGRPGSHVSSAPTDYDFRQGDWDVKEISKFTEVLFMQGYGYGWSTAPIAEPVGLLPTGTYWGSTNITTFINAVLAAQPETSRIILGLPHFGYDWPTTTANVKASTTGSGKAFYYPDALLKIDDYGRQWDLPALNPWFRYQVGTQWHQGWYDDAESMAKKYQFAEGKKLGGIGMWSLGMDQGNHDIWDALTPYATGNSPVATPHMPRIASMTDASSPTEGKVTFRWFSTGQSFVKGYRLFMSKDGTTWSPTAFKDESTVTASLSDYAIAGLGIDSSYYFKFVAVDSSGSHASDTSDTYGVRTGSKKRYLIVDGFDRYGGSGSWQKPQHDFVRYYGDALAAAGKTFDVAANEAVAAGNISLNIYSGVIWFLGDESTANRTFNSTEQNVVKAYLEGGGKLLVTGSEIAYELIGRSAADPSDKLFFTNYFKATWGGDKADGSTVSGASGNIFAGITATFGQTYPEDYPDYIVPAGGAVANLLYTPTQVAGLNYSGTFGSSTNVGVLVYLGFPFETIMPLAQRTSLMGAIVHYFETSTSVTAGVNSSPGRFSLEQNFPNPFNPVTHFQFAIAHDEFVSLKICDVLGKEVANLVDGQRRAGTYLVRWDASNFSSGVYFYSLRAGEYVETKKLVLTK
jgi:spore germination protein YaaH